MTISLQRTFYFIGSIGGIILLIYYGQAIFIPLSIGLLLAIILYPLNRRLEKWGISRVLSIIISIVLLLALLIGIGWLLSTQLVDLADQLSQFTQKLREVLDQVLAFVNQQLPEGSQVKKDEVYKQAREWFSNSGRSMMFGTLSATVATITGIFLVIIYTFLLLMYRGGFKKAAKKMVKPEHEKDAVHMLMDIQKVGQKYLAGKGVMILILGVANSLALYIIGIDFPLFFGFLAALLSLIPYIGTTIGAILPTLYAFLNNDSLVIPLAVALSFWIIQLIESNMLTPMIVGSNLNLNALVAIIVLIIGGYLWGIAGMVIALPFTAIARVICSYIHPLQPIAMLLGEEVYEKNGTSFTEKIKKKITHLFQGKS